MIFHTQGEHPNYYTAKAPHNNVVWYLTVIQSRRQSVQTFILKLCFANYNFKICKAEQTSINKKRAN